MTKVTTKTKLTCKLTGGKTIDLTTGDCVLILNAMARRRMLCVMAEDIPAGYSVVWSEECCAWQQTGESGDDEVILAVNAAEFVCATPVEKKPAKKKAAAKKRK
jgi:hypothetical protein